MSFRSLNDIIILDTFKEEIQSIKNGEIDSGSFSKTISLLKKEFPSLSEKELLHLLNFFALQYNSHNNEKVDVVVTAPPSFQLHTKLTENVVGEMLNSTKKSILMTGYSISEYINDYLDLIIRKSQSGVFVKLFVNNINSQDSLDKLLSYRGKFLKIYNYCNKEDKMSALHAKVISIDSQETLISSANLSYHGMSGNIEMGCHIISQDTAHKVEEIFKQLVFQKVFVEII